MLSIVYPVIVPSRSVALTGLIKVWPADIAMGDVITLFAKGAWSAAAVAIVNV